MKRRDPLQILEFDKVLNVIAELAEAIKTLDPANLQGIREDMDLYDHIRGNVSGLTSLLKDMNALTPDMHRGSDFNDLYNAIEERMKKKPAPSTEEKMNTSESTKPVASASSSDKSINIGKFNIGGNVGRHVNIGHTDQTNGK